MGLQKHGWSLLRTSHPLRVLSMETTENLLNPKFQSKEKSIKWRLSGRDTMNRSRLYKSTHPFAEHYYREVKIS